jgi:hypothetical protein
MSVALMCGCEICAAVQYSLAVASDNFLSALVYRINAAHLCPATLAGSDEQCVSANFEGTVCQEFLLERMTNNTYSNKLSS